MNKKLVEMGNVMKDYKSLQERWNKDTLTDNTQFENCKQCKDCIFQNDDTVWSNHYSKSCCQKYPYPKYKPVEVIDNVMECYYRKLKANNKGLSKSINADRLCKFNRGVAMERFSAKSLLALGDFYVYGLIDPRNNKIFYVGKGTGNRVFEHERESFSNPDSDNLKLKTIAEIVYEGLEVKKVIINSKLTEREAFAAEASLINIFNYLSDVELTNIVAGHHSTEALTVEDFERMNGAEELSKDDIKHKVVFIKITNSYRRNMSSEELYDVIRGVWKNNLNKARFAEYVLGVHNSLIIAVYKPSQWYKCKDAVDKLPKHVEVLDSSIEERIFFVDEAFETGKPYDEHQTFYYGKSVSEYEKVQKSINPFVYGDLFEN